MALLGDAGRINIKIRGYWRLPVKRTSYDIKSAVAGIDYPRAGNARPAKAMADITIRFMMLLKI